MIGFYGYVVCVFLNKQLCFVYLSVQQIINGYILLLTHLTQRIKGPKEPFFDFCFSRLNFCFILNCEIVQTLRS